VLAAIPLYVRVPAPVFVTVEVTVVPVMVPETVVLPDPVTARGWVVMAIALAALRVTKPASDWIVAPPAPRVTVPPYGVGPAEVTKGAIGGGACAGDVESFGSDRDVVLQLKEGAARDGGTGADEAETEVRPDAEDTGVDGRGAAVGVVLPEGLLAGALLDEDQVRRRVARDDAAEVIVVGITNRERSGRRAGVGDQSTLSRRVAGETRDGFVEVVHVIRAAAVHLEERGVGDDIIGAAPEQTAGHQCRSYIIVRGVGKEQNAIASLREPASGAGDLAADGGGDLRTGHRNGPGERAEIHHAVEDKVMKSRRCRPR